MKTWLMENRNGFVVVGLIAIAGLVWALTSIDGSDNSNREDKTVSVIYEVEGTAASASITAQTPTGVSQQSDLALPLVNRTGTRGLIVSFPSGAFVYISAQNEGEFGDITCRITVDGVVVSENTASGSYTIATCEGRS